MNSSINLFKGIFLWFVADQKTSLKGNALIFLNVAYIGCSNCDKLANAGQQVIKMINHIFSGQPVRSQTPKIQNTIVSSFWESCFRTSGRFRVSLHYFT